MSDDEDRETELEDPTWWEENETFAIIMIAVVSILVLLGCVLLACMVKYPSFREMLDDVFDSDNDDDDKSDSTSVTDEVRSLKRAQTALTGNRKSSVQTVPSLRLPTPGDAAPDNRLPPLLPVNSNAFSTVASVGAAMTAVPAAAGVDNRDRAGDV